MTVPRAILVAMGLLCLYLVTPMTVTTDVPLHLLIGTRPTLQGRLSDDRELLPLALLGVVMTLTGLSGMSVCFQFSHPGLIILFQRLSTF